MQIEINDHTTPPGGWQFFEPHTGWWIPNPVSVTLSQASTLLVQHRLSNLAITTKFNLLTNLDLVKEEIKTYTRKRLGVVEPTALPKSQSRRPLPQVVAEGVAGVKLAAAGGALLLEWEESGQPPVREDIAEHRASVCASCPRNGQGDYTRWFTVPISEMVRKRIQRLHAMKLATKFDERLGVCEACLCPLKLKVHTPLDIIHRHLRPEAKAKLWEQCWITAESSGSPK